MIKCLICGKELKFVTSSHLKYKHNISTVDYREKYSDAEFQCKSTRELHGKIFSKSNKGRPYYFKGKTLEEIYGEEIGKEMRLAQSDEGNGMYGKHQTEKQKKAVSLACKDKPFSLDHNLKISIALKGRPKTESHRHNLSLSKIGNHPTNEFKKGHKTWCKGLTKETDNRIEKSAEKSSITKTKQWNNPEFKRNWIENALPKILKSAGTHPNKKEIELDLLLQRLYPKEWKYVGNGEIILFSKSIDWININGKKEIIEFFGEHWHEKGDEEKRINYFKQFGWDCLVIWQHELKEENLVVSKVKDFMGEVKT